MRPGGQAAAGPGHRLIGPPTCKQSCSCGLPAGGPSSLGGPEGGVRDELPTGCPVALALPPSGSGLLPTHGVHLHSHHRQAVCQVKTGGTHRHWSGCPEPSLPAPLCSPEITSSCCTAGPSTLPAGLGEEGFPKPQLHAEPPTHPAAAGVQDCGVPTPGAHRPQHLPARRPSRLSVPTPPSSGWTRTRSAAPSASTTSTNPGWRSAS